MRCSHVFKSTSTVTVTTTSTSATPTVTVSRDSQPESAAGQRQQGSFMGLLTTSHTPAELTEISSTYHQQDELGLLSKTGTTQIDPIKAPATYQTITFDDQEQGQSASSLSLSNESSRSQKSSQPVDDLVVPIVREEQGPNPTDKWIMMSGDKKRPFQCAHKRCARKYSTKAHLQAHLVTHTGDSKLRCYLGDCAGTYIYRDVRELTRHTRAHHTFEKPLRCELCDKRFRLQHHLKYHMKHVHGIEEKKKLSKQYSVSKSSSAAATTTTASTITNTFGNSQPESVTEQRPRSSLVGLSTTLHTPESRQIPTDYPKFSGLRLLAEVSTSQINPFAALATHQTVTFEDEAVTTTGIEGDPNLPSAQHPAEQGADPTDKWIIVDKFQERPYRCGYPGCDMSYLRKHHLTGHFLKHTGTSKFKCPHPGCVGNEYFRDAALLKKHTAAKHTRQDFSM